MFETFILFVILFFFFSIGIPVAFSLGITSIIGIVAFADVKQLSHMINITYNNGTSLSLMVAPLFIMMSEFLVQGKLAKEIFSVLSRWLKKIPGSLAVSNIVACSIFAALCGSSPVTAATIGKISIPEMIENGYDKRFSMGSTVAGGVIGLLIPPSISMIIYGVITETSISKLFIAGIIPGILLTVMLSVYIVAAVLIKPELVNKSGRIDTLDNDKSVFGDFLKLLPIIILIILVLGTMYTGIVTPTEAAGVGVLGAFIILLGMGRLNLQVLKTVFLETANTTAMLMFILVNGLLFSFLLSSLGIPQKITEMLLDINISKWVILLLVYILWIILGALLDSVSMIVLTVPLLFQPLINLGFDPIWLGVVVTVAVCIGMITPPIGMNLFVIKGITGSSFKEVVSGSMPFLVVVLLFLLILTVFPGLTTYLTSGM